MKRTQLIRLRDGSLIRVQAEQLQQPLVEYEQEYEEEYRLPARQRPQRIREQPRKRNEQHPISMFFLFLFVGFCACSIHPVLTFLLWGFGVLHLLNGLLKRR